jgi:hypothetical protein
MEGARSVSATSKQEKGQKLSENQVGMSICLPFQILICLRCEIIPISDIIHFDSAQIH